MSVAGHVVTHHDQIREAVRCAPKRPHEVIEVVKIVITRPAEHCHQVVQHCQDAVQHCHDAVRNCFPGRG